MKTSFANQLACFFILGVLVAGCSSPPPATVPAITPSQTPAPGEYWPTSGWRTSTPEAQGMDSHKLALMLDAVNQQKLGLHSLLIVRHGYIVSETYFLTFDEKAEHELYSCTKSFISTLVGIAVDQGYIDTIKHPVLDFFPGRSF